MGYPNSDWVKPFVHGKTVDSIEQDSTGEVWIRFTDDTALRLYVQVMRPKTPQHEVIVTPFGSDGDIVQSTRITANVIETRVMPMT